MIQTMKSRLSGLAMVAAGALVASLLAVGASPAGAVTDRADHTTRLSACVGDASADREFTDVSEGHVFRGAINCIAYYGITRGTGDGSAYSPDQDVTRAQMAVFIARAAEAAGVDLGTASNAGFADIGGAWQEAQDAINRLANKGMIPPGAAFRPADAITRAEMATFLIGLLVEAAPNVSRDSRGAILLGAGGSPSKSDDYFPDTRAAEISAIYELGVTKGASAADVQEPGEPPLDLNYEPSGTVDRGQMAAFITRALAHTPVRPAGVSAQYDGADIIVSVRNASFRPVSEAAVDVFWAGADRAASALSADGACRPAEVVQSDSSSFPCAIDHTDPVTGADGDARAPVRGLRRVGAGGAAAWAWTGRNGDTLRAGADLYRLDVAEGAEAPVATRTLVTTLFKARHARFGSSVSYTLQLSDPVGSVDAGVNGTDPARWELSVQAAGQDPEVSTLVSDSTGEATFSVSARDPDPAAPSSLAVTYTLTPLDNAPSSSATRHADGRPAVTGTVTFSDAAPSIASGSATVTIDTRAYVHVAGGASGNSGTVTVLDQYGNPFPGAKVRLSSNGLAGTTLSNATFTVDDSGAHRFFYRYSGSGAVTETLSANYGPTDATTTGPTATVYWAANAGASQATAVSVVAGDVRRREIVVNASAPVLLVYDDDDRFNLRGSPTTIAAFEAELAEALKRPSPGLSLTWSNYLPGSARVAELSLS